ncbi:MAG: hypothetical protein IPK85_14945 [Gemmatimonadetes bacterium]|nr:hypothetical protein [Gemmatimonadota bacterium]
MPPKKADVDDEAGASAILERWELPQQRLATACRRLVRKTIPTMFERPYPGWNAVGFRDPQAGYFVGMFPVAGGIDLVFEGGMELEDPHGLFADRPTMRQVRVVEVRRVSDLSRPGLHDLIRQAVLHGSMRRR